MKMDSRPSLLIVQDDADLRKGVAHQLRHSFAITVCADAVMATAELRENSPDVILLDLGLPGEGGLSLLQRMNSIPDLPRIPTVILTGLGDSPQATLAIQEGAWAVLNKPTSVDRIRETLEYAASISRGYHEQSVLVVCGDPTISEDLCSRIRDHGYDAIAASDGHNAISSARTLHPDAIVVDLDLPIGGGEQILEQLNDLDTLNEPAVFLLGEESDIWLQRLRGAYSASAAFMKPVDLESVVKDLTEELQCRAPALHH